jgi:hypothetical protein
MATAREGARRIARFIENAPRLPSLRHQGIWKPGSQEKYSGKQERRKKSQETAEAEHISCLSIRPGFLASRFSFFAFAGWSHAIVEFKETCTP